MSLDQSLYIALLALVGAGRLLEMRISQRHQRALIPQGVAQAHEPQFRWMVLLHTGILLAAAIEVVALDRAAEVVRDRPYPGDQQGGYHRERGDDQELLDRSAGAKPQQPGRAQLVPGLPEDGKRHRNGKWLLPACASWASHCCSTSVILPARTPSMAANRCSTSPSRW